MLEGHKPSCRTTDLNRWGIWMAVIKVICALTPDVTAVKSKFKKSNRKSSFNFNQHDQTTPHCRLIFLRHLFCKKKKKKYGVRFIFYSFSSYPGQLLYIRDVSWGPVTKWATSGLADHLSRLSFLAVFELRTFDLDSVKHMSKGKITQDYKKLYIKSLV